VRTKVWKKLLAHVKGVNLQDKIKQVGEDGGVEESVLAQVEGVHGEDSGMEAVTIASRYA
jgi:hypothetical protein